MNRIKDKLAQSVRQARCAPAAAGPVAKAAPTRASKSSARAGAAPKPAPSDAGEPRLSAHVLFPQRVWPD